MSFMPRVSEFHPDFAAERCWQRSRSLSSSATAVRPPQPGNVYVTAIRPPAEIFAHGDHTLDGVDMGVDSDGVCQRLSRRAGVIEA
jgi:hypothetical protein